MALFRLGWLLLVCACLLCSLSSLPAWTLEELRAAPHLTPAALLARFADFKFQLRSETQSPEAFLSGKAGDCDDFANVAALVLKAHGYTPRVVVVSMEKVTHVVCFVPETQSYLDYNHRRDGRLVSSGGTLPDIAQRVAESFRSRWYSVSEVSFATGTRRFVRTEFQ